MYTLLIVGTYALGVMYPYRGMYVHKRYYNVYVATMCVAWEFNKFIFTRN